MDVNTDFRRLQHQACPPCPKRLLKPAAIFHIEAVRCIVASVLSHPILDYSHGALPGCRGTACRTLLVRSSDKNEERTASRTPTTRAAEPLANCQKVCDTRHSEWGFYFGGENRSHALVILDGLCNINKPRRLLLTKAEPLGILADFSSNSGNMVKSFIPVGNQATDIGRELLTTPFALGFLSRSNPRKFYIHERQRLGLEIQAWCGFSPHI